ncbi:hypothetical protein [Gemmobacter nectariphilus]|uniref:hypothetical protein n=1 Tax=Gemmobacter nectariphilus TaxID=220343 RepID=UPI0012B5A37C|nr:hypothetical protein [Gemmobacter nectariphilus]
MAELAQRAARLSQGDPALEALRAELEALSQLLPASAGPDRADQVVDDLFDNMPV